MTIAEVILLFLGLALYFYWEDNVKDAKRNNDWEDNDKK